MAAAATAAAGSGGQRTILITGVSRGLGRALALEMAKRGHCVVGCGRSQDRIDSLQAELHNSPSSTSEESNHLLLNVDVRLNNSVQDLAKLLVEKKRIPDIVVNNAGTINKNNTLWEVPAEEFDTVIDTNVKGVANVLRHFIPLMIERKHGIIVNLSSGWGRSAAAQVAPYCASKWAVEGLTRAVAKELSGGMAIVALSPGVIHTEMLESCFGSTAHVYPKPDQW
uniref:NADPH-dependent pterin aldehyde reductase n=2 Tax=Chenopodium quinoa TaxID=63459 RepID=A0A803M283_CHEQI